MQGKQIITKKNIFEEKLSSFFKNPVNVLYARGLCEFLRECFELGYKIIKL